MQHEKTQRSTVSWNGNCFLGSSHGFVSFKHVAYVFYGSEVKFQLYCPIQNVILNLDFSLEGPF